MSYSLVWSPKSMKRLSKLDKKTIVRIVKKMKTVAGSPYDFLEKIKSEKGFKIRVGDYRLIVDLVKSKKELHVLSVWNRRDAYKKN